MENIKEEYTGVASDTEDLFYFESDHVALKGNKDYHELLKTIAILESQKLQAVKDIDKLIELQNTALKDPICFIEKLKNNEDLGIPFRQVLPEIPFVNWSKYCTPVPEEALRLIEEGGFKYQSLPVPSKLKSLTTSTTRNQSWTSEEQKKLEELLIKYPPEAIEMRRFKKIANELGNRTVQQVTSRVQKYFLKLYKAGLPIPGRIPKTADRKKVHKHQRHNHLLYKPSTFFPDTDVPVYMTEDDEEDTIGPNVAVTGEKTSTNYYNLNPKEEISLKINLLRKIKLESTKGTDLPSAIHIGFKCDLCNEEPLKGCRWHCTTCTQNSVDYCTDCLVSQLNSNNYHPLTHDFIPLHNATATFQSKTEDIPNRECSGRSTPEPTCSNFMNIKQDIKSENESSNDSSSLSDSNYNYTNGYNSEDSRNTKDFDEDYVAEMFTQDNRKYNYLDPNFLPELYKN